jgi:hypothetical protein
MARGDFYVHVIRPMDSVFTGPFATRQDAALWRASMDLKRADGYVVTYAEMVAYMAESGEVALQSPDDEI